ncbi:CCA-adding enzyme [Paenochrobactrum sp. BZR 201-1]
MSEPTPIAQTNLNRAEWLENADLQSLFALLNHDGEEARVVGGAVRNSLLGVSVGDIDIATSWNPQEVTSQAIAAGYKTIPTGIEHGTVTVVINGSAFEVTSLRADIETDGRHATVVFGKDWKVDALRRDFTINALYVTAEGDVIDHVGGIADIEKRVLRFIGEPQERIREDYLRIMRFFRFFAWYGAGRPDTDGLKAAARLKDGIHQLSAERIWAELKKLLSAQNPSRALLWMRQAGVLSLILPESEKWGIDAVHGLVQAEKDLGWQVDALLRLESLVPPDAARMSELGSRMKMSNAERARLEAWARLEPIKPEMTDMQLRKLLYHSSRQAVTDHIHLAYARARFEAVNSDEAMIKAGSYARLLEIAQNFELPVFPVTGSDLLERGFEKGPQLGAVLKSLEKLWVDSGFQESREKLLTHL